MKCRVIAVILSLVSIALLILFTFLALKPKSDDDIPTWDEGQMTIGIDIKHLISGVPKDSLVSQFPYRQYISKVQLKDIAQITHDIYVVDSVSGSEFVGLSIFLSAFTDSLKEVVKHRISTFNPDTLLLFMMDVEGFKYYARVPGPNQLFFSGVYQYWMSELSNYLDRYAKDNPDIKYNFKYRLLVAKCKENKYGPSPKVDETEKIIHNIAESKWGYLYQRLWSIPIEKRIVIVLLFALTLYAYLHTFITILHKFKKKQAK